MSFKFNEEFLALQHSKDFSTKKATLFPALCIKQNSFHVHELSRMNAY